MKKRKGSIFLETLIYLNISIIAILMVYSVIFQSFRIYEKNKAICEMREISELVEDRIRYEIKNSMGIDSMKVLEIRKNNKYIKQGYLKVNRIFYSSKLINHAINNNFCEKLERKSILIKNNNIYIGKIGEYQIGNYVEEMYIKEKNINKKTEICFIIIYKIKKYKYISRFLVYT